MLKYIGPKGYGCSPEIGGSKERGECRMQSKETFSDRLTKEAKQQIIDQFDGFDVEIKQIDKTRKGYIRIWYNGNLWK